jgi:uncharacterized protein (DUF362 family)
MAPINDQKPGRIRLMNQEHRSVVALVKDSDTAKAVEKAFQLLGGVGAHVRSGDKVLLKINAAAPVPPEVRPEVTDPRVIGEIVRVLREGGASRVIVGDDAIWHVKTRDSFQGSGIGEAVLKAGGEVCCFDEEPRIIESVPDARIFEKLSLPKVVREVDRIINVPKMKTSFIAVVTLGIKNHLGYIPFEDRLKFHRMADLAYVLSDIAKVVKTDLTIIDAIVAMEGYGPHAGTAKRLDAIVAGTDIVATDVVATALMGIDPFEPPATQVAMAEGLGIGDLSQIEVLGNSIDEVRQHFARAYIRYVSPHSNVRVYAGGICPGCAPRIVAAPPGPDPARSYALIIGARAPVLRQIEADEVWCIGKCGIESAHVSKEFMNGIPKENIKIVPGCPPLRWYAKQVL